MRNWMAVVAFMCASMALLVACGDDGSQATDASAEAQQAAEEAQQQVAELEEKLEKQEEAAAEEAEARKEKAREKAKEARKEKEKAKEEEEAAAEDEPAAPPEPSGPPDVVGLSLPAAKKELKAAGFKADVSNTDTLFGIVVEENYTVCEQDAPKGDIVPILAQKRGC